MRASSPPKRPHAQPAETASIDAGSPANESFDPGALSRASSAWKPCSTGAMRRAAPMARSLFCRRAGMSGKVIQNRPVRKMRPAGCSHRRASCIPISSRPTRSPPGAVRRISAKPCWPAMSPQSTPSPIWRSTATACRAIPSSRPNCFERAAAHGLVPAQYRIGNLYEKGIGVSRDYALASLWYQRAAENGNARAMHNLAVLMAEGVQGNPDFRRGAGLVPPGLGAGYPRQPVQPRRSQGARHGDRAGSGGFLQMVRHRRPGG